MKQPCCHCPICQRTVRYLILRFYDRRPVWMGFYTVKARADLGWVDHELYLLTFKGMVLTGQLIKSIVPGEDFPRYLSARVMAPVRGAVKKGGRR